MIVFTYSPNGITVIRTFLPDGQSYRIIRKPKGIGRLIPSDDWSWDKQTATLETYQTLDRSEKQQIIGMLDALNSQPIRPITDMKRRWKEIIGPQIVTLLEVELEHQISRGEDR